MIQSVCAAPLTLLTRAFHISLVIPQHFLESFFVPSLRFSEAKLFPRPPLRLHHTLHPADLFLRPVSLPLLDDSLVCFNS